MKILRIVLPLTALALLSSFAVSKITSNPEAPSKIVYKKPVAKRLPVDPTYQKFIEKFDKVAFPYSIRFDKPQVTTSERRPEIGTKDESNYLGRSFAAILPEIKEGMMSRMGPDDFMAEALIKSAEKFDAVIYSRDGNFRGPKNFYAATFNKQGKLISKIDIGQYNYETLKEFCVSKDLEITVEEIKVRSKYDEISRKTRISYAKTSKEVYFINSEGVFVNRDVTVFSDLGVN
jgi:hypothetical protein